MISRSSYRNEIVNEDGLANSDFTLQWIDNETVEHLPIDARMQLLPTRRSQFLGEKEEGEYRSRGAPVLITIGKNT